MWKPKPTREKSVLIVKMDETFWLLGLRAAGVLHFVTLVIAWFTPIPPDWEKNLATLPEIHRRFAVAQNFFIGSTLVYFGVVSLFFAPLLVSGSSGGRLLCAGTALWWGGRFVVLPWLRVRPHLNGFWMKFGFLGLQAQCVIYAFCYGWLALRQN